MYPQACEVKGNYDQYVEKKNHLMKYLIRSAVEIIFKFSASANWRSLGNLAIEPSSSTISHKTETGSSPAKTARSTEASVCPALFKTPPSLYLRGKIWPGRLKSSGLECLDTRANTVAALSWADTPVVVPRFASYGVGIQVRPKINNHSLGKIDIDGNNTEITIRKLHHKTDSYSNNKSNYSNKTEVIHYHLS